MRLDNSKLGKLSLKVVLLVLRPVDDNTTCHVPHRAVHRSAAVAAVHLAVMYERAGRIVVIVICEIVSNWNLSVSLAVV